MISAVFVYLPPNLLKSFYYLIKVVNVIRNFLNWFKAIAATSFFIFLFIRMFESVLRFVPKDSALYQIIVTFDVAKFKSALFVAIFLLFGLYVCSGLTCIAIRDSLKLSRKQFDNLCATVFTICVSVALTLILAVSFSSDLFSLATTGISFVALLSPLVAKIFRQS